MSILSSRRFRRSPSFIRREDGSLTVEAVLWIPVYLLFFGLIADVSLMYYGQARAFRIVQDANRLASSGFLTTQTEIEDNMKARLAYFSSHARVNATITGDEVVSTVILPSSDMFLLGLIDQFASLDIVVTSTHLLEG